MKRFRHFLFKWFGIDWWERLGYSTPTNDKWYESRIIDIRLSRITGEIQQLYFSVTGGSTDWIPIDEELKEQIEQIERPWGKTK